MNAYSGNAKLKVLFLIISFLVCCLPLFLHLGASPIYMWDEATYANNALDMFLTNDLIVVRMEGIPDLYNTKPPFVLWMQTFSLHLFGWNEFAIRLPSALFATCTLLLMLWFGRTVLNSTFISVVSMLVLVCANGYVNIHVTRSGDLVAVLVFWMTFYVLIYLKYLLKPGNAALHFFFIAAGLTGAFLSKGIAGWFFLPFMVLIALVHGSFFKLLRQKELYIAALAVLICSGGYYYLRELMAPGYWNVVYASEISRFGEEVMSWHVQPFDFYFQNMINGRFIPFLFLLPFTWLVLLWQKEKMIRTSFIMLWILAAGYFMLISYPADKLEWYDAPLYPLLSLIIAIFVDTLIKKITAIPIIASNRLIKNVVGFLIVLALLAPPYYQTILRVAKKDEITHSWAPEQIDEFRINGAFMKHLKEQKPLVSSYSIFTVPPEHAEHYDQIKFYQRSLQHQDNFSIKIKNQKQELQAGEYVAVCDHNLQDTINANWTVTIQEKWKNCVLYELKSGKDSVVQPSLLSQ